MITTLVLLVGLAFGGSTTWPAPTSVTAADGVRLAAVWGIPAKATRGVVLVHQSGHGKEDWTFLADKLYREGVAVIAVDLRGHGANQAKPPAEVLPADYLAMQADVSAAIAALRARGVNKVSLVGAELGANLVINAAVADAAIVSVVLLSPGMEVKGIIASDAVGRYGKRPVALVAALDDPYSARSASALDATAIGEHELHLLETGGKGVKMLARDPSLEGWIVDWLGRHWGK